MGIYGARSDNSGHKVDGVEPRLIGMETGTRLGWFLDSLTAGRQAPVADP